MPKNEYIYSFCTFQDSALIFMQFSMWSKAKKVKCALEQAVKAQRVLDV